MYLGTREREGREVAVAVAVVAMAVVEEVEAKRREMPS